ncbi:MAG: ribosome biogenesis GTPase Der [Patescibacteria group bacterium]
MKKLPQVALIGRVNVGKSTLFNTLVGQRKALESPVAGTTRDYNQGIVMWRDATFSLIDTAGYLSEESDEDIKEETIMQAETQADQADMIVIVIDHRDGLTPFDAELYSVCKKYNKPIVIAINKVDKTKERDQALLEASPLGTNDLYPVSAVTGEGTDELLDAILKYIPHIKEADEAGQSILNPDIKLAIIGQPNVGKSSILNSLAGKKRAIVSPIAHTTRDAHDIHIDYKQHRIQIIDTAGIRRKKTKGDLIEKYSIDLSLKNLRHSHVALLVLDITKRLSHQDKHLAERVIETGNSVILIANKWDLIQDKETNTINEYEKYIRANLPFLDFAPIIFTSAMENQRVSNILDVTLDVWEERFRKIDDNALDKFIKKVIKRHKPSRDKGVAHPYIYRMRQVSVNPPVFELTIKYQRSLHGSYVRFLENQLREQFGFHGVPIKIYITALK